MTEQQTHKEFNTKTSKNTKTNTIKKTVQVNNITQERSNLNRNDTNSRSETYKANKMRTGVGALIFFGSTLITAIIATLLGGKLDEGYQKPPGYAPDWLFPAVWTILYIAIAIASFLAYTHVKDRKKRNTDGIWYGIHLLLNLLWPLFYFRLNELIISPICLLLMIITSIILTYRYYRANLTSGIIFTIYTLWLLYALYLNLGVTMLNLPLNL